MSDSPIRRPPLTSVWDAKERGHWGDHRYPGNCSGFLIKDLLEWHKPQYFLEVFAGGGTGFDVASEVGLPSMHLDLRPEWGGFNALADEMPTGADFVFMHPPYHNIISYSGSAWGKEAHPDDLSHCANYADFIYKWNVVQAKAMASLRPGGRMAVLVGTVRSGEGHFEMAYDADRYGKLENHIIKTQHNTTSSRRQYQGKRFVPITHEDVLIFRRTNSWLIPVSKTIRSEVDIRTSPLPTWADLLQATLQGFRGKATWPEIYQVIEDTEKAKRNPHWREALRRTAQEHDRFESPERGVWMVKPNNLPAPTLESLSL